MASTHARIYTDNQAEFKVTGFSGGGGGAGGKGLANVKVSAKVFLEGPYSSSAEKMTDNLRLNNFIPNAHPYNVAPWNYEGEESIGAGILEETGDDAIVDWVLVELRDKNDNSIVLASAAGLLQRDGDVVEPLD